MWSQRITLDILMKELESYGRSLRREERELYAGLLQRSFKHYGSIAYASSFHAWAFLLLSIMVEQEKKIKQLEDVAHRCLSAGR